MKINLKEAFYEGLTGPGAAGFIGGLATGQPEVAAVGAVGAVANAYFAFKAHREPKP